jgi:hypothetical protein
MELMGVALTAPHKQKRLVWGTLPVDVVVEVERTGPEK